MYLLDVARVFDNINKVNNLSCSLIKSMLELCNYYYNCNMN